MLPGWGALLAMLVLALALALSPARTAAAGAEEDNCAATENPIACENALPGDKPSNWQIQGVGNANLQGYATSMSVNVGETEHFKIDTTASSYQIEILRLGYYGGDGARVVASDISPTARAGPAGMPQRTRHGPDRLRQLGRLGGMGRAEQRRLGRLRGRADPDRLGRQKPDHLRRAQRRQPRTDPAADLRRHLGGVQRLRRQQPLHLHRRLPAG